MFYLILGIVLFLDSLVELIGDLAGVFPRFHYFPEKRILHAFHGQLAYIVGRWVVHRVHQSVHVVEISVSQLQLTDYS